MRESACMISYGLNIISGNRAYRIYASHKFSRYLYCTQAPSTATRSPTGSPSRRARLGVLDIPLGGRQTAFSLAVIGGAWVNVSRKHSLCCHPRTKRSEVKDLHTRGVPDLMCVLFKKYRTQKENRNFNSAMRRAFTSCLWRSAYG